MRNVLVCGIVLVLLGFSPIVQAGAPIDGFGDLGEVRGRHGRRSVGVRGRTTNGPCRPV